MRFSTPLLGIAIGAFALGCGGSDASERSTTDGSREEITIAFGARPTTLDPHIADDGAERAINDNIYETLMARTPDGGLTPGLAADEPQRLDDTTWRFTLRDGVSFHDGTAFDSRAVVASIERMIEIGESGEQHSFFSTLSGAKAIDKLTVDVITTGPDPLLPARMYWLKIIPAGAADRPDFAEQPIGTGPYRLRSFDQEIASLEANEEYWGGRPPIGIVNIAFVGDASEVDVDRRTELYSQALRLARDDAYFVFLVRVEDSYGLSERMSWTPRTDAKLLAAEMSLTT
jgi:peptide/nickel transport system substrate-binding protein